MKNNINYIRICLFFICLVCAQKNVYAQHKIVYDTTGIAMRHFASDRLEKYRSDQDFNYDRLPEPALSVWDRLWAWIFKMVGDIFSFKDGQRLLRIFFILIAVAILVFFILKITGMTNMGLFGKKNMGERLGHSLLDDNIHTINFDIAIQQAIEAGNYRLAVRLLYLQSLKNLADLQLINWQLNKTNFAYVYELNGRSYQQPFIELTSQFETNWYGDIPIEAQEFGRVRNKFDLFNRQLPAL